LYSTRTTNPDLSTLTLHDALPISLIPGHDRRSRPQNAQAHGVACLAHLLHCAYGFRVGRRIHLQDVWHHTASLRDRWRTDPSIEDRKSTRLNSSHLVI